ncbi:outer membrane beta-barrel protein [Flavobacterium sp.]|uniref:outer membrane beta-barrel protein n=1 Tax=Flavobacterium sp. TaxID=239 RepID=UPI003D12A6C5
MKKVFLALALVVAGITASQAQVTFNPTIRGGVNFSRFTNGGETYDYYGNSSNNYTKFKTTTDFYLGFAAALNLSKVYTLQPEINYSRQGAIADKVYYNSFYYDGGVIANREYKTSYMGVQVMNKFNFNKFNIQVGPGLDFMMESNFKEEVPVDFTFVLGAGFDITKNFGLEARVKKGILPVIDINDSRTNLVFSAGAYYKFDIK